MLFLAVLLALPALLWILFAALAEIAPNALEAFLLAHLEHYDIARDDELGLYLRRYYLTPKSWARKIFLHHIVRSDTDSASHDHQWFFASFILCGYYVEHVYTPNAPCGRCGDADCWADRYKLRHAAAGTLLRNKANHAHWVEIVRPVWSLVFIGKKTKTWGFWVLNKDTGRDTWVRWDEYLGVSEPFDPIDVASPVEPFPPSPSARTSGSTKGY